MHSEVGAAVGEVENYVKKSKNSYDFLQKLFDIEDDDKRNQAFKQAKTTLVGISDHNKFQDLKALLAADDSELAADDSDQIINQKINYIAGFIESQKNSLKSNSCEDAHRKLYKYLKTFIDSSFLLNAPDNSLKEKDLAYLYLKVMKSLTSAPSPEQNPPNPPSAFEQRANNSLWTFPEFSKYFVLVVFIEIIKAPFRFFITVLAESEKINFELNGLEASESKFGKLLKENNSSMNLEDNKFKNHLEKCKKFFNEMKDQFPYVDFDKVFREEDSKKMYKSECEKYFGFRGLLTVLSTATNDTVLGFSTAISETMYEKGHQQQATKGDDEYSDHKSHLSSSKSP